MSNLIKQQKMSLLIQFDDKKKYFTSVMQPIRIFDNIMDVISIERKLIGLFIWNKNICIFFFWWETKHNFFYSMKS